MAVDFIFYFLLSLNFGAFLAIQPQVELYNCANGFFVVCGVHPSVFQTMKMSKNKLNLTLPPGSIEPVIVSPVAIDTE